MSRVQFQGKDVCAAFRRARVVIVGDLILDRYITGKVDRISPEAPVPVVVVNAQYAVPGGAANVAMNSAGLLVNTSLCGVVGDDEHGRELLALLKSAGVSTNSVVVSAHRRTTTKSRVLAGSHQIVRFDEEIDAELPDALSEQVKNCLQDCLAGRPDVVILSDYAKGVLQPTFVRWAIERCLEARIPVVVDPKKLSYDCYRGATCITPNLKEFNAAVLALGGQLGDGVSEAGEWLRQMVGIEWLLVTQGAEGMTLIDQTGAAISLHTFAEEVFDVSGAGDTVVATVGAAIASGYGYLEAALLSNIAASVVVRRVGTFPISSQLLFEAIGAIDLSSYLEVCSAAEVPGT